ncbi:MAG TPA: bpX6 domain-containing protein [Ilumatobacteraceae bacterium]|nr:bpX6 domain-containing protein [Ilumatobacteraceae bacterium]HRA83910.1 bpX6 domain-containing protein [Ilumatobacteraceae bacterium]
MKRVELIHRGHVTAAGFIIDVPAIGQREARRRTLEMLDPADRLLLMPDERWLMLTENPAEVDSDRAPGAVLVRDGELLAAAPVPGGGAGFTEYRFGVLASLTIGELPAVDHSGWFDLGAVIALQPLEAPHAPDPVVIDPPKAPDLRAKAGVGATPAATNDVVRELQTLALAVAGRSNRPGQSALAGAGGKARRRFVRKHQGSGSAAPAPHRLRTAIAQRVMRSPAAGFVNRKHAQYIEELTRQFRSGDLDEALHRAIPLGGELSAALSLKLPQRRTDLQISAGGRSATSVPYGSTIQQHLHAVYRQAAKDLEAAGKIDQAAYVLAELLRDAPGCVAMLERHHRFDSAARIAEQRQLDAGTIVRLWWLAKDKKRAISVARRHGAFAAALARLDKVDPQAGDELRVEWIADLERAGDLLGAVEVAWPKPSLHRLLVNIIPRGETLGGPSGGAMRAYGLALSSTDERVALALDLVQQSDDPTGELLGFLSTFAKVPAAAPATDRRLATAYIRTNPIESSGSVKSGWWWKIRGRADTALVADLPTGKQRPPDSNLPMHLPALPPGQLAISDAAALPSGEVLVALGSLGCRLFRRNGAAVAEWHEPTTHIVMADHGGSALLLDQRPNGEVDVRRLDLTTRRLRSYGTMELVSFADSFDGAQWLVVDRTNAAIVDLTEHSPTISWRPLEPGTACHSLLRTPLDVTALVTAHRDSIGGQDIELRTWNPNMARLTNRRIVVFPADVTSYQLTPNGFVMHRGANIEINLPGTVTARIALGTDEEARTAGDLLIRVTHTADSRQVRVERLPSHTEVLRHELARDEPPPAFRSHGALVTVWDSLGRVHVIDLGRMAIVSSTRALL